MEHTICSQVIAYKVFYIYVCRTNTYIYNRPKPALFAQYNMDNTETERDAGSKAVCAKSSQKQKWKQVERERETTFRFVLAVGEGGGILAHYF